MQKLGIRKNKDSISDEEILQKAILLREGGNYDEAQECLEFHLIHNSKDIKAWCLLSHICILNKNDVKAEKALSKAELLNPSEPWVYRNKSRLLLKKSQIIEALENAKKVCVINNNDPEDWLVLANCLSANQRDEEASLLVNKVLQCTTEYSEAYASRALIRYRINDIDGAILDAEKAVSIKPFLIQIWLLLSRLYETKGEFKDAIHAIKEAIRSDPSNVTFMMLLSEAYKKNGNVSEAIQILTEVTKTSPKYANGWANLGLAYQQCKKNEEAKEAYRKALSIDQTLAEVFNNLGSIEKDSENWNLALECFENALLLKPDYSEAHHNRGVVLKKLVRFDDAIVSFKKAIAQKPSYVQAYKNLGEIFQELGRFDDSVESYKDALKIDPNYDEARFNLGLIFYKIGDYGNAEEQFKLIQSKNARAWLLKCLYEQNKKIDFYDLLNDSIAQLDINPIVGSLGCRADIRYGVQKLNLFCKEPLSYTLKEDLRNYSNFENDVIGPVKIIIDQNKASIKNQNLLINGQQTAGNIFNLENNLTKDIQDIIHAAITRYLIHFRDSKEGIIKNWPSKYILSGWIICMQNGGELRPHMHEKGWLSGSIYINVPPKGNSNSGNLVVCIEDDKNELMIKNQQKIIDVRTGDICLFPASLLHYTIPFKSVEDRIVLAFDVLPEK
jgi:tetratricopeptide (TPR) repeat protein